MKLRCPVCSEPVKGGLKKMDAHLLAHVHDVIRTARDCGRSLDIHVPIERREFVTLRQFMNKHGLVEAAALVGVAPSTYWRWVNLITGPHPRHAKRLSELGVSL